MAVLGIDTHKDTHAVIVLDDLGRIQIADTFGTTDRDNRRLLAWAMTHGPITRAGVEGTGSYGYRLARTLTDAGIHVVESPGLTGHDGAGRARPTWSTPKPQHGPCSPRTPLRSPRTGAVRLASSAVW